MLVRKPRGKLICLTTKIPDLKEERHLHWDQYLKSDRDSFIAPARSNFSSEKPTEKVDTQICHNYDGFQCPHFVVDGAECLGLVLHQAKCPTTLQVEWVEIGSIKGNSERNERGLRLFWTPLNVSNTLTVASKYLRLRPGKSGVLFATRLWSTKSLWLIFKSTRSHPWFRSQVNQKKNISLPIVPSAFSGRQSNGRILFSSDCPIGQINLDPAFPGMVANKNPSLDLVPFVFYGWVPYYRWGCL